MTQKTATITPELRGMGVLVASLLLLLSLIRGQAHDLGLVGYAVNWFFQVAFGLGSFVIFGYLVWWGWRLLVGRLPERPKRELFWFGGFLLSMCVLLNVLAVAWPAVGVFCRPLIHSDAVTHFSPLAYSEVRDPIGGLPLYLLYVDLPIVNLRHLLSGIGTTLVFSATAIASLLGLTDVHLLPLLKSAVKRWRERPKREKKPAPLKPKPKPIARVKLPQMAPPRPQPQPIAVEPPAATPNRRIRAYDLPAEEMLTEPQKVDLADLKRELQKQAEVLEETLQNFGIDAKVGDINCGPTIASFEVHPSVGVKVQRIKALENDIALNLQARSIRIIAPIPGKAAVGIEIPNPRPQGVVFKEMLAAYQASKTKCGIPLLLGKAVNGEAVITDLAKMPHLIIAGATGSGKSVCVNAIIMSILLNMRPDEIRLLMIDPKKVELTPYSRLPHMLAPVVTEPHEACMALNWLVKEMEKRYEICRRVGVRNIAAFNSRKRNIAKEVELEIDIPEHLPYIVGIVDELADLMMASQSDIETPITRIAQMARAVGIHLILATQRPSREVITGLIKANFPARIAFKVANRINSQIILDDTGAESLLGNGDMLLLPPGTSNLIRAQGTYVSDADINAVIKHICEQAPTDYQIESFRDAPELGSNGPGERDSLYEDALSLVSATGVASTTYLQRKLKVGYARAASIMDQLEANGVIGPQEGAKPRRVLVNED
jgi:DNA segregation ATPase FtsK/SpoIIIE, S-DNA-T family